MLENCLVEHCSPTLARLKLAGMFCWHYKDEEAPHRQLEECRRRLTEAGLELACLRCRRETMLLYVFRPGELAAHLKKEEIRSFLEEYGYSLNAPDESSLVAAALEKLQCSLCDRDGCAQPFPHEIGVFLGYPLEDVRGFIGHCGKHCKCCGFWKVYGDEAEALQLFDRFRRCTALYCRLFARGYSLKQLAVAA